MRPPQGPQQRYVSPVGHPIYAPQETYQVPNYQQQYSNYYPPQGPAYQRPPQGPVYQQAVSNPYLYQQNFAQNYVPLYTSPYQNYQFNMGNQQRKNIPEQTINSNFNYENANFDCDYSV